jgi:hypothetical protein
MPSGILNTGPTVQEYAAARNYLSQRLIKPAREYWKGATPTN